MGVTRKGAGTLGGLLFFLLASTTASATVVDFNTLAANVSDQTAIMNYMNGVLGVGVVTQVSGAITSKCYNGDGHVVGPSSSTDPCAIGNNSGRKSLTLGTTEPSTGLGTLRNTADTFLMNNSPNSDRITMLLSVGITSIRFNLEIFPDSTCTKASTSNCGAATGNPLTPFANWPTLELRVTDGANPSVQKGFFSPSNLASYGNSPLSGVNPETAPQLLMNSGLIMLNTTGPTKIEFIDWPPRIAIDDLDVVRRTPPLQTPEPGSLALVGMALAGLAALSRRQRGRKF